MLHLTSEKGFFIGDPCYVLDDVNYDGVLGAAHWVPGAYSCKALDGSEHDMAFDDTAYGDGEYEDNFGNTYGVDAGILGAVPLELCWQKGKPVSEEEMNRLGHVFYGTECEFDTDGEGNFNFTVKDNGKPTYVEIMTRDYPEDWPEEDEDDYWGDVHFDDEDDEFEYEDAEDIG